MAFKDVTYEGPHAEIATLTGSPLWGMSIEDFTKAAVERGWYNFDDFRPDTPYGKGPVVQHFLTENGRHVIRIPSYGGVAGEDLRLRHTDHKVFWILWKAGVKVVLIGGTSGIADWRPEGQKILPGDVVLPWSFMTHPEHRGLPGTEFESAWPKYDLLLDDPFCTQLWPLIAEEARKHSVIGSVHTPDKVHVALVIPSGITFETTYDIQRHVVLSKMISEMFSDQPPVVTLHGDCVNPVLARLLGMHVAYYHMVANIAQGLPMPQGIAETLYGLYQNEFVNAALKMELALLSTMPIPNGDSCVCKVSLHTAPKVFAHSMTH